MNIQDLKDTVKKTTLGAYIAKQYNSYIVQQPKLSYAQIGEDLILDSFLQGKKKGFYVDIGAYHPIHLSNSYIFYKRGWNGIQMEPNYERYLLFKKYRPRTTTLNVGVGPKEAVAKFYNFKHETLSTFSEESMENSKKLGHILTSVKNVPIVPLSTIFAKHVQDSEIDFISVDTEGFDMEVLQTNDWNRYRPHFVIVETVEYSRKVFGKKLNDQYDPFMTSVGYQKVADTYLNTIYCDKQYMSIN